jgi:alpha-D-xyloside xylohydrolase
MQNNLSNIAITVALFSIGSCILRAQEPAVTVALQPDNNVVVHHGSETITITACGDNIFHIVATPNAAQASSPQQPWILNPCRPRLVHLSQTAQDASVTTTQLKLTISLDNATLAMQDSHGNKLLEEDRRQPRQ